MIAVFTTETSASSGATGFGLAVFTTETSASPGATGFGLAVFTTEISASPTTTGITSTSTVDVLLFGLGSGVVDVTVAVLLIIL